MENKITVFENQLVPCNTHDVKVRRKRKKQKKLLKPLLFIVLIIASVVFVKNFDRIKNYIITLLPSDEQNLLYTDMANQNGSVGSASSSQDSTGSSTQTDNEGNNNSHNNKVFEAFLQESSSFVNESSYETQALLSHQALPKISEIYQSYGEDANVVLLTNFSPKEAYYSSNDSSESPTYYSSENNVKAIAAFIESKLDSLGVNAVQLILPESDSPLYEKKLEYEQAVKDFLDNNPSITYIFDVSRAIYLDNNDVPYSTFASTEQGYLPSIAFSYGTNTNGLSISRQSSVYFGHCLSQFMNADACIVATENVSKYSLSQDFDIICLRVDIGSFACSYEDALKSAELFSSCLAEFLS